MVNVMLVQPWNYHDEGIDNHDLTHQWRNGPYSLILLATQLKKHGHNVMLVDMVSDLIAFGGKVSACLAKFDRSIQKFLPDIIGFGFFSMQFIEARKSVYTARKICKKIGIRPLFIGGGIHASTEPLSTIKEMELDYIFVGEADIGIVRLANGERPENVSGICHAGTKVPTKGEVINDLDALPFPDWAQCNYKLYSNPTYARLKERKTMSLDMLLGRGCINKCSFCAYNALSRVRFYSPQYLIEQIEYMQKEFGISGIFFTDSSIGNNRRLLTEFCENMIKRNNSRPSIEWYGCMRSNQVDEKLLKLMWRAGCCYLFYGFESGSQRVLDLMNKGTKLSDNIKTAELHDKLQFPYQASIMLGYPGEKEDDIMQTVDFIKRIKTTNIGINSYVPLPGSEDYTRLRKEGKIDVTNPEEWRKIGEVNTSRVYSDIEPKKYYHLFRTVENLAYNTNKGPYRSAKQYLPIRNGSRRIKKIIGRVINRF